MQVDRRARATGTAENIISSQPARASGGFDIERDDVASVLAELLVSAPIDLEGSAARLAVNVEGINEHSSIAVEIQEQTFRPVPGDESRRQPGTRRTRPGPADYLAGP